MLEFYALDLINNLHSSFNSTYGTNNDQIPVQHQHA